MTGIDHSHTNATGSSGTDKKWKKESLGRKQVETLSLTGASGPICLFRLQLPGWRPPKLPVTLRAARHPLNPGPDALNATGNLGGYDWYTATGRARQRSSLSVDSSSSASLSEESSNSVSLSEESSSSASLSVESSSSASLFVVSSNSVALSVESSSSVL